jgi:type II secretory pathway pseudopilin PulG
MNDFLKQHDNQQMQQQQQLQQQYQQQQQQNYGQWDHMERQRLMQQNNSSQQSYDSGHPSATIPTAPPSLAVAVFVFFIGVLFIIGFSWYVAK